MEKVKSHPAEWEALLDDLDFLGPDFNWSLEDELPERKVLKDTNDPRCDLQKAEVD